MASTGIIFKHSRFYNDWYKNWHYMLQQGQISKSSVTLVRHSLQMPCISLTGPDVGSHGRTQKACDLNIHCTNKYSCPLEVFFHLSIYVKCCHIMNKHTVINTQITLNSHILQKENYICVFIALSTHWMRYYCRGQISQSRSICMRGGCERAHSLWGFGLWGPLGFKKATRLQHRWRIDHTMNIHSGATLWSLIVISLWKWGFLFHYSLSYTGLWVWLQLQYTNVHTLPLDHAHMSPTVLDQ